MTAGETRSATLVLPAAGEVRGILTAAGLPLAGAELFLIDGRLSDFGLGRIAGKEQSYGDGSGLRHPLALTRAGGRFTLGSVPVGAYVLEIHHAERALASRVPIEVEAPSVELSIDLPATSVRGRCDDPSALDPNGARVHLGFAAERKKLRADLTPGAPWGEGKARMHGILATAAVEPDGSFAFQGAPLDTELLVLGVGTQDRILESPTFRLSAARPHAEIELSALPGGALEVEVSGLTGAGGYRLEATFQGEDAERRGRGLPASGVTRFQNLRVGSWRVAVFHGISSDPLDAVTVEVAPGEVARAVLSVH